MLRVVAIVAFAGYASAGLFDFGGGGSDGLIGNVLSPVSGVVNTAGNLVGAAFGGPWGAIVPSSMNKGAINAACGNSFDKSGNTNAATTGGNVLGTAVGTVWSAVVPKSVNQGAIKAAETTGQTGDVCNDYKNKFDFTATADMTYSSTADRDRLLQAILSAYSTLLDKKNTAGTSIYFVSSKKKGSGNTVTYRIAGLSKVAVNPITVYQKFQSLFQQNPPQGITGLSTSVTDNTKGSKGRR